MTTSLDTPCIGVCSTVYGDEVCRGCKRFYDEIIDWNHYPLHEKEKIFQRLESLIIEATHDKITITDADVLGTQLKQLNIRHSAAEDPLCWAFYLLRQGHHRITDIEKYGIKVRTEYSKLNLKALYHEIDNVVSRASYQIFKKKFIPPSSLAGEG